jgi:hypothetical protein
MENTPSGRILAAWVKLEEGLRAALPVCSVAPPTQPSELLSALRINGTLGPEEEERIRDLREVRNRVAHDPTDPPEDEAKRFEEAVATLLEGLGNAASGAQSVDC